MKLDKKKRMSGREIGTQTTKKKGFALLLDFDDKKFLLSLVEASELVKCLTPLSAMI